MSDFNSSLPVRTETDGDVVVKISDGTTPSQHLAIDAAGKVEVKLDDAAGNALTSQANGSQRALDVGINVAGVQIDPRDVRALTSADVVTADQGGTWSVHLTDGTNSQAFTAAGEAKVEVTQPLPAGTNNIGKIEITDGTNVLAVSAGGALSANVSNLPTTVDTNFGAASSSTLRTASEIGNASGAADFGVGAAGAQTLRVSANLAVAGAAVTSLNPIPVTMSSAIPGDAIQDYATGSAIAAAASSTHDYVVSALKSLQLSKIWASASGKIKVQVQYETAAASGIFNTKFVGFNSTANPNVDITVTAPFTQVTGAKIRVIITNLDKQAEDVYSTIEGMEI